MAKSTTDLNISCAQTGTSFATDVTQALIAINSAHRSSTEPTYNLEDGVMWLDTSASDYQLKMRIGGAWKVLLDLNSGVFETSSEASYVSRLDGHDDKHDGTTQIAPDLTDLVIDGTTITTTPTQINYVAGVTSNIQAQINQKNGFVHPSTTGNKHIPTGGAADKQLIWASDGTAQWADSPVAYPSPSTVGQTELKTSSGTVSVSGATSYTDVTLPGGSYGFFPQFATASGGEYKYYNTLTSSTYVSKIQLKGTITCSQRYVTSSPPYNLGDGDIDLFVFLHLDSEGNIKSTYASTEPPWAYNGATDISPDYYDDDGVGWQSRDKTVTTIRNGEAVSKTENILREIDYDFKNSDMADIPHPFTDTPDWEVVMLNPFQDETQILFTKLKQGEDVSSFITDNVSITADAGDITTPPNVKAVNFKWCE